MKVNEAEMFNFAQNFDEDCKFQDFSVSSDEEEQEAYSEYFNLNSEAESCMTAILQNDEKAQKLEKILQKVSKNNENQLKNSNFQKKERKNQGVQKFKDAYFAYYDDIKIPSHKVTDW